MTKHNPHVERLIRSALFAAFPLEPLGPGAEATVPSFSGFGKTAPRLRLGFCYTLLLFCGCQLAQNPFTDELAGRRSVTTPSVDAVRAASVQPSAFEAHGEAKMLPNTDGSVTHGPLYFEDPFEDTSSDDGKFAWSGEDYLWMFYWRGRYLVNAVAFPASAAVAPPWTVMVSDGRPSARAFGEQHDAVRRKGPVATAEPAPDATGGS